MEFYARPFGKIPTDEHSLGSDNGRQYVCTYIYLYTQSVLGPIEPIVYGLGLVYVRPTCNQLYIQLSSGLFQFDSISFDVKCMLIYVQKLMKSEIKKYKTLVFYFPRSLWFPNLYSKENTL